MVKQTAHNGSNMGSNPVKLILIIKENSSTVEHWSSKSKVKGSNPFFPVLDNLLFFFYKIFSYMIKEKVRVDILITILRRTYESL